MVVEGLVVVVIACLVVMLVMVMVVFGYGCVGVVWGLIKLNHLVCVMYKGLPVSPHCVAYDW